MLCASLSTAAQDDNCTVLGVQDLTELVDSLNTELDELRSFTTSFNEPFFSDVDLTDLEVLYASEHFDNPCLSEISPVGSPSIIVWDVGLGCTGHYRELRLLPKAEGTTYVVVAQDEAVRLTHESETGAWLGELGLVPRHDLIKLIYLFGRWRIL